MSKAEFLDELAKKLSMCPKSEVEKSLSWYSEIIDDRLEEMRGEAANRGENIDKTAEAAFEAEIISSLGNIDNIADEIKADIPIGKIVKEKVKSRHSLNGFEIALLIIGSPIWLSLLFAAVTVIFSVYVVIWSVGISLWATTFAIGFSAIALLVTSIILFAIGKPATAVMNLGGALLMAGLTILFYIVLVQITKGFVWISSKIYKGIKLMITGRKERA